MRRTILHACMGRFKVTDSLILPSVLLLLSLCEVEDQADSTEHNPQSSKRVISTNQSQVEPVNLSNWCAIQWYSTFFFWGIKIEDIALLQGSLFLQV